MVGGVTFSQNFSSYGLGQSLEDSEQKDDLLNELINELMAKMFI